MFMVIIAICSITKCFNYSFDVHMNGGIDRCMLVMMKAAVTLHIAHPDWDIQNVECIPVAET